MAGCAPVDASPEAAPQYDLVDISPLTRTGGQYRLDVAVTNGVVTDAQLGAGSFQALELAVLGRSAYDAVQIMQRQNGLCPVAQAVAACMALEQAAGLAIPSSARALRNLMQASAMLAANLTHFYQQTLPDYVQGPDVAPYALRYAQSDLRLGPDASAALAAEALQALAQARLTHEMIAVFGGRSPQPQGIVPGGTAQLPTRESLLAFLERLRKLRVFVEKTYLPRVYSLAAAYKDNLFSFGQGYKAVICAGALPLTDNRVQQVFRRGIYAEGKDMPMDARLIKTFLRFARFATSGTGQGFRSGVTAPEPQKTTGYSFVKAARYEGRALEAGSLARMWVTNPELSPAGRSLARQHFGLNLRKFRDFGESVAFSLMGRHLARAEESFYLLPFMERWLQAALPGQTTWNRPELPEEAEGVGLTEAPQGALLHYTKIKDGRIIGYQLISPDMWNASPKDDLERRGVIEEALVGVPVPDLKNPVNLGRLVRSFGI